MNEDWMLTEKIPPETFKSVEGLERAICVLLIDINNILHKKTHFCSGFCNKGCFLAVYFPTLTLAKCELQESKIDLLLLDAETKLKAFNRIYQDLHKEYWLQIETEKRKQEQIVDNFINRTGV